MRTLTLADGREARLIDGALSADACAAWIGALETAGFACMAHRYPPGYRNNHRAVLDDPQLAAQLFARLRPWLPSQWHDDDGATWDLVGLNPRFRACRYRPGEGFCIHRDGAQATGDTRTFRTLMLYLSPAEAHEGGSTRFYPRRDAPASAALTVVPRRGTAVVFPHDAWHDGEVVRAGTKYVLRSDLMYRRRTEAPVALGHCGYVWDLSVVDAARHGELASVGRDGRVVHWRREASGLRAVSQHTIHEASLTAIATLGDRRRVVGDRRGTIRFVDGDTHAVAWRGEAAVLALRPFGPGFVATTADGALRVFDGAGHLRASWPTEGDHRTAAWRWALDVDGDWIASGVGPSAQVLAWRGGTLRRVAERILPSAVRSVAFGPTGDLAVGLEHGGVWTLGARGRGAIGSCGRHRGVVRTVTWLDAHRIASGGEDDHVRIWSRGPDGSFVAAGHELHDDFVTRIVPLGGGALASASYDETVRVWSVPP